MNYHYLEHTADVLFEAYGKDLNELFRNTGLATEEVMVELKTLTSKSEHKITLEEKTVDDLLYHFLEELIFLKDTELLLFKEFEMNITEKKNSFKLYALCKGEKINRSKHKLGRDVKAVTLHEFEVKKENSHWKAKVLLDI